MRPSQISTSAGNYSPGSGVLYSLHSSRESTGEPAGERVPYIFRGTGNGSYEFLGETYVHEIMHGEAVKDKETSQFSEQEIALR